MPDTDGFAVIDALRADPATVSVPVVVLTAKSLTEEDRSRLRGGSSSSPPRASSTSAAWPRRLAQLASTRATEAAG